MNKLKMFYIILVVLSTSTLTLQRITKDCNRTNGIMNLNNDKIVCLKNCPLSYLPPFEHVTNLEIERCVLYKTAKLDILKNLKYLRISYSQIPNSTLIPTGLQKLELDGINEPNFICNNASIINLTLKNIDYFPSNGNCFKEVREIHAYGNITKVPEGLQTMYPQLKTCVILKHVCIPVSYNSKIEFLYKNNSQIYYCKELTSTKAPTNLFPTSTLQETTSATPDTKPHSASMLFTYRPVNPLQIKNTKWQPPSFLWIVLIVCGSFLFIFNVLEIKTFSATSTYLLQPQAKVIFAQDMEMKGYLIRSPGCSIPEMNVMDQSIKQYIFKEDVVICNNGTPPLINSNITSLYTIESSLNYYNINDTELLNCCYTPFYRQNPKGNNKDNVVKFDKKCREFKLSVDVKEEFVKVVCSYNNTEIYKDFFDFVPLKNTTKKENSINKQKMNVLVIGIDAVSRLNLHRQMPITVKFLEHIKAVEMLGYNKVGDNTFPNLIPVLTGLTEDELKKNCWPKQNSHFDRCPFLWKKFKEAGYVTAFGEDSAWMGLFQYTRQGFKNQPTDYYWNHFDITAETQIGNMHRLNVNQCIGSRSVYKVFLDYITKFSVTMHRNHKPYFAFFWGASLSHDYLNKPKLGDNDYANMLSLFNKTGVLNNTVLIVMSDHGIRWGDIRSIYQGRMEERLPFLYIKLPDWYIIQNSLLMNNLKTNKRRLTTPFDLHETLLDLISSYNLTNSFIGQRLSKLTKKRGYSLFDQINTNRTCADAGISPHWCTCQSSKKVDIDDPLVVKAANFAINEHINKQLLGYADCAVLELDEILDASVQINNNNELLQKHYIQDYTITFKTKPGGAIFEATVRVYVSAEQYHFNIMGTVSRINLYGKQSLCITDFHLKLYCYCKQYIPED